MISTQDIRSARGWPLVARYVANPNRTNDDWKKVRSGMVSKLGSGFSFALIGKHGLGKTQMAVDVMLEASDRNMSTEYTSALGFFLDLKASYHRDAGLSEREVMESFARPKLLVIDEFEKRGDSDWANNLIFELLNRRYGMLKDTLILSNLDKRQFGNFVSDSVSSRINQTGGLVVCNWPSFR
jgi:DNA replication protein DnaC